MTDLKVEHQLDENAQQVDANLPGKVVVEKKILGTVNRKIKKKIVATFRISRRMLIFMHFVFSHKSDRHSQVVQCKKWLRIYYEVYI